MKEVFNVCAVIGLFAVVAAIIKYVLIIVGLVVAGLLLVVALEAAN